MVRASSSSIFVVSAVGLFLFAACSGGMIAVGKTDQQLQKQANGDPTGNGQTCSWQGTSLYAAAGPTLPPEASRVYNVGDDFKSLDGCNNCSCTAGGIACTVNVCNDG